MKIGVTAAELERQVVGQLWQRIELTLSNSSAVLWHIGDLSRSLPDISSIQPWDLPSLVQLHLSSAANLMETIRLMAPSTFPMAAATDPACTAIEQKHLQATWGVDDDLLSMVSALIALQLFLQHRAAALIEQGRLHLRKRAASSRRASDCSNASSDSSCASCFAVDCGFFI